MGVNSAFFDGSTRFISENINSVSANLSGTQPRQIVSYGSTGMESEFGVWGSLGTINCGENKTLH